jgi:plastocyanin
MQKADLASARGRTKPTIVFVVVALFTGASLSGGAGAKSNIPSSSRADAHAARSYVQVSAREYYYGLSRASVKHGTVTFELVNYGDDDHDLAIRRKGSSTKYETDVAHPGERKRLTRKLTKGTYVLWCTIDDHRSRGMSATLRVKS